MDMKGKISIVTGGGQGIGRAACLTLAQAGADVFVADIQPETAGKVSEEIRGLGRKSASFELDVSNKAQVEEMVETALASFGRIDVLVNVAGIGKKSPIEDVSEEDWDRVINVNLKGTFLCAQAVGKVMIKQGGGSIVNFASVAGHTPQIFLGAYSASKAGVLLLTKLMAIEWARYNIRVNSVSPGPITTPLTDAIYNTEDLRRGRARAVPMNRFGQAEEVAVAVAFLASDESTYITGHSIVIDGGSLNAMFYLTGLVSQ